MSENIWVSIADGNVDRVKELISADVQYANIQDDNGYSPLHAASSYNNLELIDFILQNGGNVNILDNDGDSPLHVCESVECAIHLIKNGADYKILNKDGFNAIQAIGINDQIEVAKGVCDYLGLKLELPGETGSELDSINGKGGDDDDDEGLDPDELDEYLNSESLDTIFAQIMQDAGGDGSIDENELKSLVLDYIKKEKFKHLGNSEDQPQQ
ncbi:Ankyrin repeat-containing protein [Zancudomyces culisetae]|uniref:Ankyrin repeat-containing protein n=1 Tax=Zancudomyces culisetae TaxID=1213189 RepID=A0A1R1PKH9_ZANCU|nr:Ankyrin repeat-containing protein [Zancudomyces culisetae]OMH82047.1 Ankyrin repeat-containing protein [Zancudomyces culisetae]|eukprot:OMH81465.1 Ankyrin repeat-containing protein [Zancudomyces culisetae]